MLRDEKIIQSIKEIATLMVLKAENVGHGVAQGMKIFWTFGHNRHETKVQKI